MMFLVLALTLLLADPKNLDAIRVEATRWDHDAEGRPLPLAGHWHTGTTTPAYGPAYQLRLLGDGEFILPWLILPEPGKQDQGPAYYASAIRFAAHHHLPLVFISTQWERLLSVNEEYFSLRDDRNPNVTKLDGTVERKVSPFAGVKVWRHAGRRWTRTPMLRQIQEWYPDPPLVLFLSNNEASKLRWTEVEGCRDFVQSYGQGKTDEQKRALVAAGYQKRYQELFDGMREALVTPEWRRNARFIGYNAFVPPSIGRWPGWPKHSLTTRDHLSAWTTIWQGASMPFYTHPWDGSTDCNLWSPQVEGMNWAAARGLLPKEQNFWFELSTWDGNEGKENDKRGQYAKAGQTYGPERYEGMVQYGLWLTQPRSLREFRGHTETRERTEAYFRVVLNGVRRVHESETLAKFWRKGKLVANTAHVHPYQTDIPAALAEVPHWFQLSNSLDPPLPWKMHALFKVFALAHVLEEPEERRYLLYAHAPLGEEKGVKIQIPNGPQVTVDVPRRGGFWEVSSKDGTPKLISLP